ncbi:Pyrimidine reductase, riboflavin biosynthesis [Sanguibacter gelidistatuariae]|uniref:Pyrimidine reductase, riboflavin biosynthesis n=1 Tax=Sanguibacter gelidistatuariae TaxID=1814289 RepID=A0A1G6RMC3_9MICO|nr:dihydrofolate reductase family protein [Sanguibacter gelidistatuariae]SDD05591.1 Pyrimidine reductase, riboflavin biosynthesis [Sanguibacter gelidistatuariae]
MSDDGPHLSVLVATGPGAGPGTRLAPDPAERELSALYTHPLPTAGRTWLRANMVTTIDGAAWGATGRSGSINNSADFRAFCAMRAMADVVMVGAGTVRTEGYTPVEVPPELAATRSAAGLAPGLTTAVVTRSGHLPDAFFTPEAASSCLVLTTAEGAQALEGRFPTERVVVAGIGDVDLRAGLAELARRSLPRVLCEGGPTLLGDLVAAGVVDELCVTTSPQVVGGPATRIVHSTSYLRPPAAARLGHLLVSDGVLLARWVVADEGPQ